MESGLQFDLLSCRFRSYERVRKYLDCMGCARQSRFRASGGAASEWSYKASISLRNWVIGHTGTHTLQKQEWVSSQQIAPCTFRVHRLVIAIERIYHYKIKLIGSVLETGAALAASGVHCLRTPMQRLGRMKLSSDQKLHVVVHGGYCFVEK